MNDGAYSKKILYRGTLNVSQHRWWIYYYFPEPDLRHNGDAVAIRRPQFGAYTSAFKENYAKYEEMIETIPSRAELQMNGKMDMTIRVNDYFNGVSSTEYQLKG